LHELYPPVIVLALKGGDWLRARNDGSYSVGLPFTGSTNNDLASKSEGLSELGVAHSMQPNFYMSGMTPLAGACPLDGGVR
jgi:hypothetical protein